MKSVLGLVILICGLSTVAQANDIQLRCTAQSEAECETRVASALTKMGCAPQAVECRYANEVDGDGRPTGQAIYCGTESLKCDEPKPYLFGGTYCNNGGKKVSLRSYDRKLTLDYAMGVFGWVRSICIAP